MSQVSKYNVYIPQLFDLAYLLCNEKNFIARKRFSILEKRLTGAAQIERNQENLVIFQTILRDTLNDLVLLRGLNGVVYDCKRLCIDAIQKVLTGKTFDLSLEMSVPDHIIKKLLNESRS
ncbi:hypothetical protein C4572_01650 [Candidatus Parcubacteria bacterium]|nr:MAG: hypothetical protein C4572_01650 [Candidatus Parcubacteria bacterium]